MTKIEWTQETWNPITGCTKISTGCRNCYAERMAKRLAGRYGYPEQPNHFDITVHGDKLTQPCSWVKPRMIFACSMGDLFHDDVDTEDIMGIIDVMLDAPQHTYQILTKRPERMKWIFEDYLDYIVNPLPDNIWLGVTAENQEMADKRIPWLLRIPAAVRFVSVEPMLGPVNLKRIVLVGTESSSPSGKPPVSIDVLRGWMGGIEYPERTNLDWVICGGETGHGAREMKPEWAWDLLSSCRDAGVPFFFKKAGDATAYKDHYPITREYPTMGQEKEGV